MLLGVVFDEPNLYERLTARLNLAFCFVVRNLYVFDGRANASLHSMHLSWRKRASRSRCLPLIACCRPERGNEKLSAHDPLCSDKGGVLNVARYD